MRGEAFPSVRLVGTYVSIGEYPDAERPGRRVARTDRIDFRRHEQRQQYECSHGLSPRSFDRDGAQPLRSGAAQRDR